MALFLQLEQKGANGYGFPADKTIVLLLSGCAGSFFVGPIPTFSLGVRTWGVAGRYAPSSRRKESENRSRWSRFYALLELKSSCINTFGAVN